jgi:hypothetical protein
LKDQAEKLAAQKEAFEVYKTEKMTEFQDRESGILALEKSSNATATLILAQKAELERAIRTLPKCTDDANAAVIEKAAKLSQSS